MKTDIKLTLRTAGHSLKAFELRKLENAVHDAWLRARHVARDHDEPKIMAVAHSLNRLHERIARIRRNNMQRHPKDENPS